MQYCPSCQFENKESAKFCGSCGAPQKDMLDNLCVHCGIKNLESAKFCKKCGHSFTPDLIPGSTPTGDQAREAPKIVDDPIKLKPGMRILSIEETGEIMEEIEDRGDEEGLHVLSGTFAETLDHLARSREELALIEERIGEALKLQREKEEEKLREMTATYELTQKKIQALEELSALRRLQSGEIKLAKLFRGEIPDIEGSLFEEEQEMELEDELDEIQDLDLDTLDDFDDDELEDEFGTDDDEFNFLEED